MVNVTYDAALNTVVTIDGEVYTYPQGDMAWIMAAAVLVMYVALTVLQIALLCLNTFPIFQDHDPWAWLLLFGNSAKEKCPEHVMVITHDLLHGCFPRFFWGYSLTFSPTGSVFIGDLANFGMINVMGYESAGGNRIPDLLYAIYQCMFATITPVIAFGASAERGRLGPIMVLVFCWSTIVYAPCAHWTWSPLGWDYILGGLDYAGGGPVHQTSGWAALAYSIYIGKRRGYGTERLAVRPASVANVVLGTALLYFGWFGFNGGSAANVSLRAIQSMTATNIAAATGGLTWMLMDWRIERKWSTIGLCSGIVAGLVGITPAAGYVGSPASLAIGVLTAAACNMATKVKFWIHVDDALDVWALHGVGGGVGAFLTGLFADSRVASFDGITEIPGGWINHHYIQLGYQLAGITSVSGWSFVVTLILCFIIDHIPGLHLRVTEEDEIVGIDISQCGEVTYDFVHHRREVGDTYQMDPYNDDESSHGEKTEKDKEAVREIPHEAIGRAGVEMTETV